MSIAFGTERRDPSSSERSSGACSGLAVAAHSEDCCLKPPQAAQGPPPTLPASQVNPICKTTQMPASPFQHSLRRSLDDSARMDKVPHCSGPTKESTQPAVSSLGLTRTSSKLARATSLSTTSAEAYKASKQSRPRLKRVMLWKMSANQASGASGSELSFTQDRSPRGSRTFHIHPRQGKISISQNNVLSDTSQTVSPRSSAFYSLDDTYMGGFALSKTQGRRSSWCPTLECIGPARIPSPRPHEPLDDAKTLPAQEAKGSPPATAQDAEIPPPEPAQHAKDPPPPARTGKTASFFKRLQASIKAMLR
ncbi:hypothetical protein DUNSADRAFT_434 [Dunaliella salina]|uniref:Encoded protein n=1 Tax=Dunaliella salina TaxID=3046 RepID=A0ABQ7FYX1_DUNSA|nr:hypothetical protein DUNSADRAFT_434 [Dunaliella salina]|eukprot:KAF5827557.1 hypothetical protein DUNSADRAFT_434 [Dunaliella salina]